MKQKRLSNKYKYNPIWISGHFNLPDISWKNKSITGGQDPHVLNESFIEKLA